MVYGAVALLNQTHTPGLEYQERAELAQGSRITAVGIAAMSKLVMPVEGTLVNGTLSAATDWAAIGIELKPRE